MQHRREIDGLRAVAVLPVILFHAGWSLFSGGFVGVDVFFVISGFLITSILLEDHEAGTFTFRRFYERRARRILPALFFVVGVSCVAAWFILPPTELEGFSASVWAVPLFGSNVLFYRTGGYFSTAMELKPLLHTWSLAIEEQFYVLFPVALVLVWRHGRRSLVLLLLLAAVASFGLSVWYTPRTSGAAYLLLPTRAWELMVGALAACLTRWRAPAASNVLSGLGLGMVALAVLAFDKTTPFPGWQAAVPVVGTALVLVFGTRGTVVGRLLAAPAAVAVGLVSYSAYLWHQPLFAFARTLSLDEPGPPVFAALIAATFAAAYVSWRFVEAPVRTGRTISQASLFRWSAIASVAFVGVGVSGQLAHGLPTRFDAVERELLATTWMQYEADVTPCWSRIESTPSIKGGCRLGRKDARPQLALLGDSQAGALLTSMDTYLDQAGLAGVSYTFRSCAPLRFGSSAAATRGDGECARLRASFFEELRGNEIPGVVVVNARWAYLLEKEPFDNREGGIEPGGPWSWGAGTASSSEDIGRNIQASIREIVRSGRKVVLIYPVPEMGWDVPTRLAKLHRRHGRLSAEDASVSYQVFRERTARAYSVLSRFEGDSNVIPVLPETVFCNTAVAGRCIAHVNGRALYYDNNHLSPVGARMLMEKVKAVLGGGNPAGPTL